MHFGLLTDSGCNLPAGMCSDMGIIRIPATIKADGKEYPDDDRLNPEVLDAALSAAKEISTSAPSTEAFLKAFEEEEKKGVRDLIVVTVGNLYSDSYICAVVAGRLFTRDGTNGRRVKVVESRSAGAGQDQLLMQLQALRLRGQTFEQAAEAAERIRKTQTAVCLPGDMERLFRTGRLPVLGATLLRKVKIFSLLSAAEDGAVHTEKRKFGRKKALRMLREMCAEQAAGKEIVLVRQGAEEETAEILEAVSAQGGKVLVLEARGAVGYYLGPNGIMAAFSDPA